jgi:hypothetical protein
LCPYIEEQIHTLARTNGDREGIGLGCLKSGQFGGQLVIFRLYGSKLIISVVVRDPVYFVPGSEVEEDNITFWL